MAATAAVQGFFAAGALGALVAFVIAKNAEPAEEAEDQAALGSYKHVSADGALSAALAAPAALFTSIDRDACAAMLRSFDALASIYQRCRRGEARPSLAAEALMMRREASNRLLALMRRARQERPTAASELAEDFEALKKQLGDYIHNINQEQGLHGA